MSAAETAGGAVVLHDLYGDGFDPRLPVSELPTAGRGVGAGDPLTTKSSVGGVQFADTLAAAYAADLVKADVIVVVHPVWFFNVPAVLKGWVDRVVREDVAFAVAQDGAVTGLLAARSALIVTTANTSTATEAAAFGAPLETFWRSVVFGPAGVRAVERLALTPVRTSQEATRSQWLAAVAAATTRLVRDAG